MKIMISTAKDMCLNQIDNAAEAGTDIKAAACSHSAVWNPQYLTDTQVITAQVV